jgi:hypothetical protein
MKITLNLDDELTQELAQTVKEKGETIGGLIERALHLFVEQTTRSRRARQHLRLPVSAAGGSTLPGVDLSNSAALLDVMENDEGH